MQIQKKLISDKECYVVDVSSQPVSYQLNRLRPTTDEELRNIVKLCPSKTCSLDACPTKLLKRTVHIHIPYVVAIVNNRFEQGIFPNTLRTAVVKPLLKSDTINKDLLKKLQTSLHHSVHRQSVKDSCSPSDNRTPNYEWTARRIPVYKQDAAQYRDSPVEGKT